jgi:BspA type Leucine rich repeat region (6 copies)/Putative Ig domain/Immunoglobulin domain/MBG domain
MKIKVLLRLSFSKIHYLIISILCFYVLSTKAVADILIDQGVEYSYSGSTASVLGYTVNLGSSVSIPASITVGGTTYSVTSIADNAFRDNTSLSSVSIPSSVTSIGDSAFNNCANLNRVTFNEITAPTIFLSSFSSIKSGAKGLYPYVSTGYTASTIQSTSVSGQLAMISSTTVTSVLTASGTVGSAFTYTITGAGGSGNVLPNSFTASPLPSGLSIDLSNGRISGTPTAAGIYNVTIGFQDAMSYPLASATLVITIPAPTPTLTFATPIAASVYIGSTLTNLATSSIPPPSGGAITYSSANTAVATVSSSGVVTGVSSGTSVITATQAAAVGVNASTLQTYTITVSAAPAPVIPSKIAAGISISNTTQSYTGKPLPVTTSLSPSTLSAAVVYYPGFNVPTDAGTYYVLVNVVDNTYYGSQSSVLTILPAAQTVSIATPTTLSIGVPVSLSATSTTNGPITYSVVSGNATLSGSTLTALDSNPVTIKATQAGTNNYQSASATVTFTATPVAIAITSQPTAKLNILQGNPFTLSVTATGTAPTYQWYFGSTPITGATASTYTLASTAISNSGSYTCLVTNSAGSITSSPSLIGIFAPIATSSSPKSQVVNTGSSVALSVNATGTSPSYQWYFNNTAITGATSSTYTIPVVTSSTAGSYYCVVSNAVSSITTASAQVALNTTHLQNLSARSIVGTSNLSVGFVSAGSAAKSILLRGDGPSLANYGVTGVLANPVLTLYNSSGTSLAANSAWGGSSNLSSIFTQVGAFPLVSTSTDTALLQSLTSGTYSAIVTGANSSTGAAMVEIYDADPTGATSRLVNISARGTVGSGTSIMTGGFVITGNSTETILIRAVGPTLLNYGVTGVLAQPTLTVYNASGTSVATNTIWGGGSTLSSAMTQVGAFALPSTSADSAVLVTLPAGAYTVQVSGVNGTTGNALVEIYEVSSP